MDKSKRSRVIGASIIIVVLMLAILAVFMWIRTMSGMSNNINSDAGQQRIDEGELRVVSSNLDTPWSIVFYGETPLVSSRNTGQIFEISSSGTARAIGAVDGAIHRGEGGLLGLAINESYLYAYYTTISDNRISRFVLSGERGSLSFSQPETIIEGLPSASNHNGGRIAFGPDGMLYATTGDAGDPDSTQDRAKLSGKILRMTLTGDVPHDNPFPSSLVYSYGHRNPQGLVWDDDSTMYSSEFGQNAWDELNIIKAGANYGWPVVEGIEQRDGFESPVQQWATRDASPSGMAFANGTLYLANLRGSVLRAVPTDRLDTSREYFSGEYGRIRDVTIAPDGTLLFITNNTDGRGSPAENDDRIISVPLSQLD